jgi:hypothetical protein
MDNSSVMESTEREPFDWLLGIPDPPHLWFALLRNTLKVRGWKGYKSVSPVQLILYLDLFLYCTVQITIKNVWFRRVLQVPLQVLADLQLSKLGMGE